MFRRITISCSIIVGGGFSVNCYLRHFFRCIHVGLVHKVMEKLQAQERRHVYTKTSRTTPNMANMATLAKQIAFANVQVFRTTTKWECHRWYSSGKMATSSASPQQQTTHSFQWWPYVEPYWPLLAVLFGPFVVTSVNVCGPFTIVFLFAQYLT
jgi:hypothetical protein